MKIVLEAPGDLEVENVLYEKGKLSMTPLFYGTGVESTAAVLKVYNLAGAVIGTYIVKVNGKTAKVTLVNRDRPVKPLMEQVK